MNTQTISEQFEQLHLIKGFEIEVLNKQTNETDYILFNIEINENNFKATHEALTKAEQESKKIAFKSIEIDEDFSLDENLRALHEECINAIITSDFFELPND